MTSNPDPAAVPPDPYGFPASSDPRGAFGRSSFMSPPLFMPSRDNSGFVGTTTGSNEPVAFTAEDRLLLKMVYRQQQAISAQLNVLATWIEHFGNLLTNIDKRTRVEPKPHPFPHSTRQQDASDGLGDALPTESHTTATPSDGTKSLNKLLGTHHHPAQTQASAATPPSVSASAGAGAAHRVEQQPPPPRFRHYDVNQASTPPGAHSGSQASRATERFAQSNDTSSAANRSTESVSAAWDPNRHLPAQRANASVGSSRSSTSGSRLGRQENPLLAVRSLAAASGTGKRASTAGSRASSVNTSIDNISSKISSQHLHDDAGRTRPQPYIAPPQSSSAAPSASMARLLGEGVIPPFRTVEKDRTGVASATATGYVVGLEATSTLLNRGARLSRSGEQQLHAVVSAQHQTPNTGAATGTSGTASAHHSPLPSAAPFPGGGVSVSGSEVPKPEREGHQPHEAALHRLDEDPESDSLSDGYGSYDSRQYMKSVGLL